MDLGDKSLRTFKEFWGIKPHAHKSMKVDGKHTVTAKPKVSLEGKLREIINRSKLEEKAQGNDVYLTAIEREILNSVISALTKHIELQEMYHKAKATNLEVERFVRNAISYEYRDISNGRSQVVFYGLSEDPTQDEIMRASNVVYQIVNRVL